MNWNISPEEVLTQGPVIPVIVIEEIEHAVPLAKALLKAGVKVLEVTLRTEQALEAIAKIADEVPEAIVGAGTVIHPSDLKDVEKAGGQFAISPGLTPELLDAASAGVIPLIPGISSASELMAGLQRGYSYFKFFPAEASGGIKMLKALSGPFPGARFCPTGGITESNFKDYLRLPNVVCVGGSWLAPKGLVRAGDWDTITRLAKMSLI